MTQTSSENRRRSFECTPSVTDKTAMLLTTRVVPQLLHILPRLQQHPPRRGTSLGEVVQPRAAPATGVAPLLLRVSRVHPVFPSRLGPAPRPIRRHPPRQERPRPLRRSPPQVDGSRHPQLALPVVRSHRRHQHPRALPRKRKRSGNGGRKSTRAGSRSNSSACRSKQNKTG